jgi:thiol-disulfide isomerase/thioredoxin
MPKGLVALVVALALAGCAGSSATDTGAGFVSGSGTVDFAPDERDPAPDITATTLEGEELSLSDFDGVVVLNFWASWCGPCASEAPDLVATHEAYGDRGVSLLGVNVRDSETNARSFERDFGIPYPSWFDADSSIASRFGGIGPSALPTTIIVDDDGRVASRLFGAVTEGQLAGRLDALLAEREEAVHPRRTVRDGDGG